jgi:hypothetical protein
VVSCFRVYSLGFRVQSQGFRVLGFRVSFPKFRFYVLGFM